ncbi:MAG: SH3 domain-containing protein [Clostridia bacterium]|nr:SH3 domain-containing protein [Clostridia bacterium]
MKRRIIAAFTVLSLLMFILVPGALAGQVTKYVYTRNGKPLNVRIWPDVNSTLIGQLPYGSRVLVENYTADYSWATITYNGRTAYVSTQYLVDYDPVKPITPTPAPAPSPSGSDVITRLETELATYRVVTPYTVVAKPDRATGWVNLRYTPSTEFGHAANLYANSQLTVLAETANWLQVRQESSGIIGYVMRQYTIYMGVGSSAK